MKLSKNPFTPTGKIRMGSVVSVPVTGLPDELVKVVGRGDGRDKRPSFYIVEFDNGDRDRIPAEDLVQWVKDWPEGRPREMQG